MYSRFSLPVKALLNSMMDIVTVSVMCKKHDRITDTHPCAGLSLGSVSQPYFQSSDLRPVRKFREMRVKFPGKKTKGFHVTKI